MVADGEKHREVFLFPPEHDAILVIDGETESIPHFAVQFVHFELLVIGAIFEKIDRFKCLYL